MIIVSFFGVLWSIQYVDTCGYCIWYYQEKCKMPLKKDPSIRLGTCHAPQILRNLTFEQCLTFVSAKRPAICPNDGFQRRGSVGQKHVNGNSRILKWRYCTMRPYSGDISPYIALTLHSSILSTLLFTYDMSCVWLKKTVLAQVT